MTPGLIGNIVQNEDGETTDATDVGDWNLTPISELNCNGSGCFRFAYLFRTYSVVSAGKGGRSAR